jgi:putative DNA primase/helicase
LIPSTPRLFGTAASSVGYDENASCPAWYDFLQSLFGDDAQRLALLQEWAGYLLARDTSQQKALMIPGPKRAGKGTIGRVFKALVGVKNTESPSLSSLGRQFGLSPLIGNRLALFEDVRLNIDRNHREPWSGSLEVKFVLLTNELPTPRTPRVR